VFKGTFYDILGAEMAALTYLLMVVAISHFNYIIKLGEKKRKKRARQG
jgi:hypothetical protein